MNCHPHTTALSTHHPSHQSSGTPFRRPEMLPGPDAGATGRKPAVILDAATRSTRKTC